MNTTDLVHYFTAGNLERRPTPRQGFAPSRHELAAPVRCGIVRARRHLIELQRLDGSWAGSGTDDVAVHVALYLESFYLHRECSDIAERAAAGIRRAQQPDGSWSNAPHGPIDLDASVLAYFARKLAGDGPNQPDMIRARQAIRRRGGADACGASTRLWLALLGQVDYECCPAALPESLLATSVTACLSAAEEVVLAAQSVIWALRPLRKVDLSLGVRELFIEQPQNWPRLAGYLGQPRTIGPR